MRSTVLIVLLPLLLVAGCAGKMDAKRGLSEEWRLRSLEENFLNFKEGQRQQEEQIDGQQRKVLDRVKALEEAVVQLQEQAGATPVRRMEAAPMPLPVPAPAPMPAPMPTPAHPQPKAAPAQPKATHTKTKGVYSPPKPVPSQPDSIQPKHGDAPAAPAAPEAAVTQPIAPEVVQGASESPEDKPWAVVPGQEHASPPAATPEPSATEQGAQPNQPVPAMQPTLKGGTAQYNEGMSLVRAEKAEPGRKLLEDFLAAAPDSSLVPNAIYWIGESFFVEKNYPQAILTFKDVTRRFPKHHKAAAALLKIGMCYEKLGEKDNAALYLRALLKDYPKSEPAPFARKKLAELGG